MYYEWLKNYQKLEDKIVDIEFNLERSKKELKRWVQGDLTKVKLTSESRSSIRRNHHVEGKTLISIADELNKSLNYIYNNSTQIMEIIKCKYG